MYRMTSRSKVLDVVVNEKAKAKAPLLDDKEEKRWLVKKICPKEID